MGSYSVVHRSRAKADILGCEQWNICSGQAGLFLLSRKEVVAPSLQQFVLYWEPIYATGVTEFWKTWCHLGAVFISNMLGYQMKAEIEFKVWEWQLSENTEWYATLPAFRWTVKKNLSIWRRQRSVWSFCEKTWLNWSNSTARSALI